MPSETPQKAKCARCSDQDQTQNVGLNTGAASVTASRHHRGVISGPIGKRKHLDLRSLEHLVLTLAAYAASGTARALAEGLTKRLAKLRL
jgi:hypothetical protein